VVQVLPANEFAIVDSIGQNRDSSKQLITVTEDLKFLKKQRLESLKLKRERKASMPFTAVLSSHRLSI